MKYIMSTLILLTVTSLAVMAQFVTPPAAPPDVIDSPIDGGLGLLLGVGAAYGAKKLRDRRRNTNEQEREGESNDS